MKRIVFLVLLIVAVLLVTACGKPPETQIQESREAYRAAEEAGAPKYAAEAWNRARQAMEALDAELEAQNGKFSLFRSYRKAAELAEQLATAAKEAGAETTRRTSELRNELSGMIADLKSLLQTARTRLASLPRGAAVDAAALRARLSSAGERIDQAQRSLDAGRYDEAMARAGDARETIRTVLRAVDSAAPPAPSKKR
jgi:hypothetical protein